MTTPSSPDVRHGDCLVILGELPENSVDAIVTDPPYGLGFMGRAWDGLPPGEEWAAKCLRVLKPGGMMLSFGGTRTWHRLAVAIEDAGFEMRDSIAWLHGQGFPKGQTTLKPAFEPVVVARKPLVGTVAQNVTTWGTGALNVDACRISGPKPDTTRGASSKASSMVGTLGAQGRIEDDGRGRWPANALLSDDQAVKLDQQSGTSTSRVGKPRGAAAGDGWGMTKTGAEYQDSGGASRFFYVAKASRKERPVVDGVAHPTVKPVALMRWLVRLVTPPGGLVLDPFAGSGTTVEACMLEGFRCLAIEREAEYLPLIQTRIDRAMRQP